MNKNAIFLAVFLVAVIYFLSLINLGYSQDIDETIKYYEQEQGKAQVQACMANLRMIYGAKKVWAIDKNKTADSTPAWDDLIPTYMRWQPTCLLKGTYTIGRVDELPTCSIKEHNPDPSEFK
ncbi:MAG: hypothetical protein Q7S30_01910 [Candidatus Omnitrophota bacterium]|nr:hypothetical protein [Candidatus Omnitrophota bacterium]